MPIRNGIDTARFSLPREQCARCIAVAPHEAVHRILHLMPQEAHNRWADLDEVHARIREAGTSQLFTDFYYFWAISSQTRSVQYFPIVRGLPPDLSLDAVPFHRHNLLDGYLDVARAVSRGHYCGVVFDAEELDRREAMTDLVTGMDLEDVLPATPRTR